jgi:hypothetical protein
MIFQAYEEGEVSFGEQFDSPPYSTLGSDKLKTIFSDEVSNKIEILN